jgi:REP element-mobilizing transposase RayT
LPRQIIPGRTYLVTRRCTQRQFLLRPDGKTNRSFEYCLAEAAARTGMWILGWLAMSNHYHAVVHDPHGRLPEFLEQFHKMLAKVLNARWSRWENLWSTEPTSVVYLPTLEDIFDKIVYTLTNPVAGHLVERASDWPGATAIGRLAGDPVAIPRPHFFFRARGKMPKVVSLRAECPPGIDGAARGAWVDRIGAAVAHAELQASEQRRRDGIRLVGRRAVLKTAPFAKPKTPAPRRTVRPQVATRRAALCSDLLEKLRGFRVSYAIVRRRYAGGERDVVFPAGTYLLRKLGVACSPFPTEEWSTS